MLFYLGAMQWVVVKVGWLLQVLQFHSSISKRLEYVSPNQNLNSIKMNFEQINNSLLHACVNKPDIPS